MTVNELLKRMSGAYAGFDTKAIEAFAPAFRTRLQRHEGGALEDAANAVLGSWRPHHGQRFPLPADFDEHLPDHRLKLPSEGPRLDFAARDRRLKQLMEDWRKAQGDRVSKGIPEVMRALEFIAQPIAEARAWSENPQPVMLSTTPPKPGQLSEIRTAWHRAISMKRRELHGYLPRDANVWWQQIEAIGVEWGVKLKREDWESTTKKPDQKAAA